MKKSLPISVLIALLATACNKDGILTDDDPEDTGFAVLDYRPAPGQFIGDHMDCQTAQEAITWAEGRLAEEEFVSLGAFGGYITVTFGHSVSAFAVKGNCFTNPGATTAAGSSNEPGIVYVMRDRNHNGKPDDGDWIELRGSESDNPATLHNYTITYYRPEAPKSAIRWTDNLGNSGTVDYVEMFHSQDSYFPQWITEESYTLRGTCIPPHNSEASGRWTNAPYPWGYADNTGEDTAEQWTTFSLANAAGAKIDKIDFIRVMTAVNANCGILGEVSTEVCGFREL